MAWKHPLNAVLRYEVGLGQMKKERSETGQRTRSVASGNNGGCLPLVNKEQNLQLQLRQAWQSRQELQRTRRQHRGGTSTLGVG